MKSYKILVIIAIVHFTQACGNKIEKHPITNQKLKEALTVKDSSYFVYIDSLSGITDSGYVNNYINEMSVRERFGDERYDVEYIQYYLSFPNKYFYFLCEGEENNNNFRSYGIVRYNDIHKMEACSFHPLIYLSSILQYDFQDSKSFHLNYYDSLKVRNTTYYEVLESKNISSIQTPDSILTIQLFYSVKTGLIKYKTTSGVDIHIWELDRYNRIK